MLKKIFSKINLIRFGVVVAAIAAIIALLPRADHQSFSYELNQPWKYPLLTAEFDIPIYRDSTSARLLRDSIDRVFIPFVKEDTLARASVLERFSSVAKDYVSAEELPVFNALLSKVLDKGLIDNELEESLIQKGHHELRLVEDNAKEGKIVVTVSRDSMWTSHDAFVMLDSMFLKVREIFNDSVPVPAPVLQALSISLQPTIVLDTVTDQQYRSQEYLNVEGALGTIKTGQRIVDRGEIITPQIYTNLNTYMEKLANMEETDSKATFYLLGQGIYIVVIFVLFYFFLAEYRPLYFNNGGVMIFLVSIITIFTIFSILMFEYVANGLFIVPFAALPVIILVFTDSRTAIFSLVITVLLAALVATFPFQFIFMEVTVGLVATFSILQLSRRSQLLRTAIFSFAAYVLTYLITSLISVGDLSHFSAKMIGYFGINTVILSFAYVFIFVIEKIFGFTSTVTLVELSDINNPVLRRLAEEAPGTFQHSLQVSTLAAEAARAIGANTTLARTGALYHDIGKLSSPVFFTENQHGVNPHSGLDPEMSAKKIISHVSDGVALANKAKLPPVIKSFILEHHGRGMAKYFYNTAVNQNPDKVVDKAPFSYPGPNPQSVETAILMMSDAVEAASRSLKEYTPESISNLVDNIINGQVADGLFRESPITFRDVETVKAVFKRRLSTIYHTRVSYPQMRKDTATAEKLSHT